MTIEINGNWEDHVRYAITAEEWADGCHVNHSFPGCSPGYDDFCIQTRLITACSLLDGLGLESMADEFALDQAEMQRLAVRPSDRLEDA